MAYKNLSVKESLGLFYMREKQPTEGYEKVEWTIGERSGVTYHKIVTSVKGKVSRLTLEEANFDGKPMQLKISLLEEGGDFAIITIPLEYSDKSLTKRIKAITPILGNLKEGMDVEISLNRTKKNEKGKLYPSVFIKNIDTGENLNWTYHPQQDVPPLDVKSVRGKDVYDSTNQDEFVYNKLIDAIKDFPNPVTAPKATTVRPSTTKVETPVGNVEVVEEDMDDDLPFG